MSVLGYAINCSIARFREMSNTDIDDTPEERHKIILKAINDGELKTNVGTNSTFWQLYLTAPEELKKKLVKLRLTLPVKNEGITCSSSSSDMSISTSSTSSQSQSNPPSRSSSPILRSSKRTKRNQKNNKVYYYDPSSLDKVFLLYFIEVRENPAVLTEFFDYMNAIPLNSIFRLLSRVKTHLIRGIHSYFYYRICSEIEVWYVIFEGLITYKRLNAFLNKTLQHMSMSDNESQRKVAVYYMDLLK